MQCVVCSDLSLMTFYRETICVQDLGWCLQHQFYVDMNMFCCLDFDTVSIVCRKRASKILVDEAEDNSIHTVRPLRFLSQMCHHLSTI